MHEAAWVGRPIVPTPMILLLVALRLHLRLGLQVIIEAYIRSERIEFTVMATVHGSCYILIVVGVLAILLVALR